MSWMTTPAGCRHEAGRAYMRGSTTGWQRGFGFARLFSNGTVHQYPVVVQRSTALGEEQVSVEGFTYVRPGDLKDPPNSGQWITDYRLK